MIIPRGVPFPILYMDGTMVLFMDRKGVRHFINSRHIIWYDPFSRLSKNWD